MVGRADRALLSRDYMYIRTCNVALFFCRRILCPRPRILPSLFTRHAPMGMPPSFAPCLASSRATLKPASSEDMTAGIYRYRLVFLLLKSDQICNCHEVDWEE